MGKKLTLAHFVKYLRVLLDEHLKWAKQVTQVKIKLNREIGILSEIQNITNRNTLKMIYHFFFFFFFWFSPSLWTPVMGENEYRKTKKTEKLQNRSVRKILFKKHHSYNTRSAAKKLLDIPLLNSETYRTRSSKYNCIID